MTDIGYIGPYGAMFQVPCFPVTKISASRNATIKDTTSGVRRAQVSPASHREWGIDFAAASPEMLANLAALANGEYGYGPFWLIEPYAQVSNIIPPKLSSFVQEPWSQVTPGGPITLADGNRAGRHFVVGNTADIVANPRTAAEIQQVPVQPGVPVCGSYYAYGPGPISVRLSWYAADRTHISNTTYSNWTSPTTSPRRVYRADLPPSNAAGVLVGIRGVTRIARPAITYTDHLLPWGAGMGAPQVMLPLNFAQNVLIAQEGLRGMRYASANTTIREVGDA